MNKMGVLWLITLASLSCSYALMIPNSISSDMVLQQQPMQARLWGYLDMGEKSVTVNAFGKAYQVSPPTSYWEVLLDPQPASFSNVITFTTSTTTVTLTNVAVGDVYLCTGQSNMEFVLIEAFNGTNEVADSINYPGLRLYANTHNASYTPLNDTTSRLPGGAQWVQSAPDFVNGIYFSYFSALCYFNGRQIYKRLGRTVPIGLLLDTYGGTNVESWSSPAAMASCGNASESLASLSKDEHQMRTMNVKKEVDGTKLPLSEHRATVLWFGMIYPILPMVFKAVLWYQGESNAVDPTGYACRFPAMINDWRLNFRQPNLPFYFVLLAAYNEGGHAWPLVRQSQLAALKLPYTDVATAHDMGDLASPDGNIHPRNKSILGDRTSNLFLYNLYGFQDIIPYGPSYSTINFTDNSVLITFDGKSRYNQELQLSGTGQCGDCCNAAGTPITFVMSDKSILNATVSLDPKSYTLTAAVKSNAKITAVQLNWNDYAQCVIINSAKLPMLPFQMMRD